MSTGIRLESLVIKKCKLKSKWDIAIHTYGLKRTKQDFKGGIKNNPDNPKYWWGC